MLFTTVGDQFPHPYCKVVVNNTSYFHIFLDIDGDVNLFVWWNYFHKNIYIVGISVFNNGSNLQQSVKYFGNHRTTIEILNCLVFLATENNVPYIITISRTFLFVLLQLNCQFHIQCCMVLQGGLFLLALVDYYGANFSVFILGTVEIVGLAWIYGTLIYKQLNTLNFKYHVDQLFLLR